MTIDQLVFYNLYIIIMKKNESILNKNEMNESKIDVVNSGYDFEWFGDNLYDNFVNSDESLLEAVNVWKFDSNKIDELVEAEDYMWFQEYLDKLGDADKNEAMEYIENNYPEFLEDEDGNLFEPMKWWKVDTEKEIMADLNRKPGFDKNDIKLKLWDALLESYKDAA